MSRIHANDVNGSNPSHRQPRDAHRISRPFKDPSLQEVFYLQEYHPVQAGSIDGTDTSSHDRAVKRAMVVYNNPDIYDPLSDPKMIGNPELTLFVGNLSPYTTEGEVREVLAQFGRVENIRLVRDIVTGASRRYAFVEFGSYVDMWRAYRDAHNVVVRDLKLLVEWNRQRLMPGWVPRRFGGGLGGQKTSGQLRFGGRNRPFRAPLKDIPVEDLKMKGMSVVDRQQFLSIRDLPPLPESMMRGIQHERQEMEEQERQRRRARRHDDKREDSRNKHRKRE